MVLVLLGDFKYICTIYTYRENVKSENNLLKIEFVYCKLRMYNREDDDWERNKWAIQHKNYISQIWKDHSIN